MGYYFLLGWVRLCVLIGYGHGPLCACECPKERQRVDESNNVCPDQPMGGAESWQLLRLGNGGEHVPRFDAGDYRAQP